MKKLIQTLLLSIVALFSAVMSSVALAAEQADVAGATLQLNGLGVHTELRNEWFLDALYLASTTDDAEDAVTSPGAKRMELRVLADSLSGRRLKRFWVERIKNNNEASNVLANAKDVRDFATLMDQDLVRGDIVTVDLIPGVATLVNINGSEIGRISPEVFPLVLRTWIGDRPPSTDFKEAMLGDASSVQRSELINRFSSIQPSPDRVARFDQAAVAAAEEEERKRQEAEEERKRQEAEEERKRLEEEKRKQEEQKKLEEQQQAQEKKAEETAAEAEAERLRKELEKAQKELAEKQEAEQQGPSQAEIEELRSQYSKQLGAHYIPYFEYPTQDIFRRHGKSALMRPRKGKTHGDVSISIEVDREGLLVGGSLVSSSGEKILDDAVMNALFDSVPFPSMPEDLPGETFKTTVSISIPAPEM
ncbi:chalcone isomerase family protein [Kangiella sediminilitoris]|uniref:TonB family protein n=1 Tax=Kangiella sediminilitoris TaxID=1144748 RepID=A0A1B3BB76_9GAMM|nr:chalcone isomerase family protein [Kangiella sediminilitoris]AOE50061.1 TonB family protein [Kangiella sediminilitoris]